MFPSSLEDRGRPLKDDLTRSVTLGFKMVAGLSSGMNHLSLQGISLSSLGPENFDIFLDLNDRFLISIDPPEPTIHNRKIIRTNVRTCSVCYVKKSYGSANAACASTFTSIIGQFLARAVALPAPPTNRKMARALRIDPVNIMVYPTAAMKSEQHGIPFGLVELPKL
ncbi:hypothetical protein DFH09DRAFT_1399391 [Mycena vulgaris]|nr:hypothetical protein DFH09DRAFT_1399391 [Mycena vulgaris]